MPFITEEDFKLVKGAELVKLQSDLKYKIPDDFPEKELRGVVVTAKKGRISDLASFPRLVLGILLGIYRKLGKHRKSAVIHDKGYDDPGKWSKAIWDLIFLYAMRDDEVKWFKRKSMYYAVKFGGGPSWRKHRKRDE
ncbi:DUF1353 domain-containing protein [Candidatus Pacearchaeota archaeon]|nr:DUF1353 domain-containing protein [Candidatus Pacearchaeota archaeon]